jgi:hypothetical protein
MKKLLALFAIIAFCFASCSDNGSDHYKTPNVKKVK